MKREVRVGWQRPAGNSKRMISMARLISKQDGSLELFIRVGRDSGMITEEGPLVSGFQGNPSDRDMGRVRLSGDYFPDEAFDWIAQASQFTRHKHDPGDVDCRNARAPHYSPWATEQASAIAAGLR